MCLKLLEFLELFEDFPSKVAVWCQRQWYCKINFCLRIKNEGLPNSNDGTLKIFHSMMIHEAWFSYTCYLTNFCTKHLMPCRKYIYVLMSINVYYVCSCDK